MRSIKNKSFEIDIDLEHFINEHADRLSHNFFTQHFDLGTLASMYEINFKKDRATGNWSADILHQLCTEDITQRKESYEKPVLAFSVFESLPAPEYVLVFTKSFANQGAPFEN